MSRPTNVSISRHTVADFEEARRYRGLKRLVGRQ